MFRYGRTPRTGDGKLGASWMWERRFGATTLRNQCLADVCIADARPLFTRDPVHLFFAQEVPTYTSYYLLPHPTGSIVMHA